MICSTFTVDTMSLNNILIKKTEKNIGKYEHDMFQDVTFHVHQFEIQ